MDFASTSYYEEPKHIRVGLLKIRDYQFKVLLNPTDQKRCLRLIVRTNHSDALDRNFAEICTDLHIEQTLANQIVAQMVFDCGAKNVNVRYDGNNKFAEKPEREGLHYHILGRFDHGANVLSVYNIDYEPGTKGDIPLGTGKKPLSSNEELQKLSDALRPLLRRIVDENKEATLLE